MSYRNIQGMRAIAALMVVSVHVFQNIALMRTHWAKPFFSVVGGLGVDIFFVISGFIIYQVMRRSIASMDIGVAMLIDRGFRRFHGALLAIALIWMAIGTLFVRPGVFDLDVVHWGRQAAILRGFARHVVWWGMPAALFIYGIVVLELRQRWIMPRVLQYLGNASFSIYLWHVVVFNAVAEVFTRLGWVGVVNATGLTALMVAIALGFGLLSYRFLEKPLLRLLGQRFLDRGVSSHSLETDGYAR